MQIDDWSLSPGLRRIMRGLVVVMCMAAASGARAQGTQAEQDACTPDVFRLCSSQIPNVDAIVACLRSSGPSLSPACHDVMFTRPAVSDQPAGAKKVKRRVKPRHHE